ncbi:MAG: hypothetical protein IKA76_06600 [Clostridia bacterium]|nr:hypothetical protein [Clostridia bacterium]
MSPNQNTRPSHTGRGNQGQYGSDETRDFQSFEHGSGRGDLSSRTRGKSSRKRKKRKPLTKKQKLILLIAGGALALILIVTVIILIVTASNDITHEDISYLLYSDSKGKYHIMVNGEEVDHDFYGEAELIPSKDRSFAYVLDRTADGIRVYVLEDEDLNRVTPKPIEDIIALAELAPGVIYLEGNSYMFFSEDAGEHSLAKKNEQKPRDFMISGDASTVIYSATDTSNNKEYLYMFRNKTHQRTVANLSPFAVSNYGDYIYASGFVKGVKSLICINPEDTNDRNNVTNSAALNDSLAPHLNVEGNEIIYYLDDGRTMLYEAEDNDNYEIARATLIPVIVDPEVVVAETFSESYLMGENQSDTKNPHVTYYINDDYEGEKIANFHGKFSTDGDSFYYINQGKALIHMDLTDSDRPTTQTNLEDVVDFVITEKNNVYSINDNHKLYFYKASSGKITSISWSATDINFYDYANTLFFAEKESENVNVWSSEEGSNQEKVKMDKIQISRVPSFSHPHSKRCYVYYQDPSTKSWHLFYTKNGSSYNLIDDRCTAVYPDGVK